MAVNEHEQEARVEPSAESSPPPPVETATSQTRRGPPLWIVPLYLGGLVLVYIGERVLSGFESGAWIATLLGLVAVVVATAVRFSPRFRIGGERREIENLLAILSVTGLVGLFSYFAASDWGMDKLGLTTAALDTQERIEGILTVLWIVLIAVAVIPMLFAEAALYPMRHAERPESRRVRAAAASGLTLALAATYGSLLVFSAEGLELRADYSYFKTSRPSDSTKKIAQSLKDTVQVVAFFPDVNEVKNEVARYLSELAEGIPKLKVEVKDRLLIPKQARDLRATQDGIIVLVKGSSNERLVLGTDIKEARKKLKTLDQDFQEKLLKIVRSRRTAYLTVGHGELNDRSGGAARADEGRTGEIVKALLQKQNYLVRDLGLSQGLASEVPDDASVVIVLGPSEPFAREEIATLKRYMDRGGHLLLALDPDAVSTGKDMDLVTASVTAESGKKDAKQPEPAKTETADVKSDLQPPSAPSVASKDATANSLKALAAMVGLKFDEQVLANEKLHVRRRFNPSDHVMLHTSTFSSHASVSTLSRNAPRAAIVVSGSGSLDRGPGATEKVDFTVRSSTGTFADANRNYQQEQGSERSAIFNLAAAVSKPMKDGGKAEKKDDKPKDKQDKASEPPEEMRAFVVADADAFSDLVMSNVLGNQVLFVDAVRWLGGEESFAGEVNTEEDVRIEHTKKEDLIWFYATIFGAPMLVLAVGLAISRRTRRSKGGKK